MERKEILAKLHLVRPRIHCLTNPVTMQDVANILLACGGSAIMAQDPEEAEEITAECHGTLLNTGVPDREKFLACVRAGRKANELGHPVILDPVGVGASRFRRDGLRELLSQVNPSLIRCNQGEACTLLHLQRGVAEGVESGITLDMDGRKKVAEELARAYSCTVLVSGNQDVVSDGERTESISGGDRRIARITGGGCMLSALCAMFASAGTAAYEAAREAGRIWKESSGAAGQHTDAAKEGMGSFHQYLFDEADRICRGEEIQTE